MINFDVFEKAICKELETIEQAWKTKPEMSTQDLDRIDKLFHALKDLQTCRAMKEAEEYGNDMSSDNMSGYRGRAANGRFVSRESQSYAEGYSRGYDEGRSAASRYMPYRFDNGGRY